MPEIQHATLLSSRSVGSGYHRVVAEAHAPLEAAPGQWAAFHTDLPNPEKPGQTLRRAWSFAELDGTRFVLLVAVVGACTRWLAARSPGETLRFTGPWGSRFRLDESQEPASFFAVGSGISPIGLMVDRCVSTRRAARLVWEVEEDVLDDPTLQARLQAWREAGVNVEVGARCMPVPDGSSWWMAGNGERLDMLEPVLSPLPERMERFYTPRPASLRLEARP